MRAALPRTRSTTLGIARAKQRADNKIPSNFGDFTKRIDGALPGKHTRQLYDQLTWKEANVLAQLRTGMARLNDYLYRIKAAASQQCACGHARETVDHSLFQCTRRTATAAYRGHWRKTQKRTILGNRGPRQTPQYLEHCTSAWELRKFWQHQAFAIRRAKEQRTRCGYL